MGVCVPAYGDRSTCQSGRVVLAWEATPGAHLPEGKGIVPLVINRARVSVPAFLLHDEFPWSVGSLQGCTFYE